MILTKSCLYDRYWKMIMFHDCNAIWCYISDDKFIVGEPQWKKYYTVEFLDLNHKKLVERFNKELNEIN